MHIGSTIGRAALLACLAWSAAHPLAHAQDAYPNRPVTLTHGFAAGGNGDVISRIVGEGLSSRLGQPFVVEARPGAGGNTASRRLASSPPDGYTLITLTGGHAVSAALYKSLPFHPVDDFQMITTYGYTSFMVAVKKDSPIKTVADLIAAAKAAPGKLTFSSVGVGSTQHLSGELFAVMAGIKMIHVPYRGGTAPITDLIGGQIDVAFELDQRHRTAVPQRQRPRDRRDEPNALVERAGCPPGFPHHPGLRRPVVARPRRAAGNAAGDRAKSQRNHTGGAFRSGGQKGPCKRAAAWTSGQLRRRK